MSDEKQQSGASIQTTGKNSKIDVAVDITEILKLLITTHFWPTLISLLSVIFLYFCVAYNLNIPEILTFIIPTLNIAHGTIFILICLIGLILIVFNQKLSRMSKFLKASNDCNDAIANGLEDFRSDMKEFKNSIDITRTGIFDTDNSIRLLSQLINDNVLDTKRIISLVIGINNAIKKIPDKDTIINLMTSRTKVIFCEVMSVVSEYLTNFISMQIVPVKNSKTVVQNLESKHSFIVSKMKDKIEEIKGQYIIDVYELSKGSLDLQYKPIILENLNTTFDHIIKVLIEKMDKENSFDQIIYSIDVAIKQLSSNLENLYKTSIHSNSILDM